MSKAWVIGSGLSAATCVHELRQFGIHSSVFEKEERWGGLVRSDRMNGVIYEPHGSHLFHTDDEEVWDLVNSLIAFNDYEHRVQTMVRGELLTWPIQMDEVNRVYGKKVARQLESPSTPDPDEIPKMNFEEWCSKIMPREVYEDFVKPYTEKQWGRAATELAADFAPKRVQVRTDGDDRLFKDRFQGFPDGGLNLSYEDMLIGLFGQDIIDLHLFPEMHMTLEDVIAILKRHPEPWRPRFIVITVPLDDFAAFELGELEWRGLTFSHSFHDVDLFQQRMVVNWPGKEFAWIRTHETKHASRQKVEGTVVSTEFTGGPERYYPVPGLKGKFRNRNELYKTMITNRLTPFGVEPIFVGRLANFMYLDMDDVIRQALDAVRSAVGAPKEVV